MNTNTISTPLTINAISLKDILKAKRLIENSCKITVREMNAYMKSQGAPPKEWTCYLPESMKELFKLPNPHIAFNKYVNDIIFVRNFK